MNPSKRHSTQRMRALGLLLLLSLGCSSGGDPVDPDVGKKRLQVYAHRGARSFAPENAIPGYTAGLAIGTHRVDMDIVMTRDAGGAFITDRKHVKDLTLAEVQAYDVGRLNPDSSYGKFFPAQLGMDGVHMPTLREVIRHVNGRTAGRVGFQIEFKTDPEHPDWTYTPAEFAAALYRILSEEGIVATSEIQSFDWRCLYELQKLDSRVRTAYLTEWDNQPGTPNSFFDPDPARAGLWTGGVLAKDHGNSIPQMVKDMGGTCWEPEDVELTRETLDEAHRLGLKVVVWTWPDDPGQLISMLAAHGYALPVTYR